MILWNLSPKGPRNGLGFNIFAKTNENMSPGSNVWADIRIHTLIFKDEYNKVQS